MFKQYFVVLSRLHLFIDKTLMFKLQLNDFLILLINFLMFKVQPNVFLDRHCQRAVRAAHPHQRQHRRDGAELRDES
jgi:hypothetical protein